MTKNELKLKISQTAQKLEIRENLVLRFLILISSKIKRTSKEIIREIGLPQVHSYRLIHEFTDILETKSKFIEVKTAIFKEFNNFLSEICMETNINSKKNRNVFSHYKKIRPTPDRHLDQFNATRKTVIKRVKKIIKNGDLENKEIVFLGDDDLTSVATALVGKAKKITVFEIDDRLNKLITQISKENNLNIEVMRQDLRQPILQEYFNKYDIVFTDPPYTIEGVNIFLNQAINLMKKNFLGRIYLCYGNSDRAREREVEIQKLILDHNLIIKAKLNHFNQYYGAESIGSQSSLYVLDWTPSTKIIKSNSKKLYTND